MHVILTVMESLLSEARGYKLTLTKKKEGEESSYHVVRACGLAQFEKSRGMVLPPDYLHFTEQSEQFVRAF